ncbi:OmpA family protein [soil metagenome]
MFTRSIQWLSSKTNILCLLVFLFLLISISFSKAQVISYQNLGENINSIYDEQNPIISPDGKTLYFLRSNHPENTGGKKDKGDIWYSVQDHQGNWQKAQNIGAPINNAFKNDIAGISSDGNIIYLHNNYNLNGKLTPGLFYSQRTSSGWSVPEKMEISYFYNASEHQSASISSNGKIMILSMDSYGTVGAEDLYVSFRQPSGIWTEPINLGVDINTSFQEMTPFLAEDNVTLFFVSNGWKGSGSKDIFKSKRLDNTWKRWSAPENLGAQVNSEGMEMYYFQNLNEDFAYLASTKNSDGYGDINRIRIREQDIPEELNEENLFPAHPIVMEEFEDTMFQVPDTVIVFTLDPVTPNNEQAEEILNNFIIKGKVLNSLTSKGIIASIILEKNEEKKGKIMQTGGVEGDYFLEIPEPGDYKIIISAKGFLTSEEKIMITKVGEELVLDFPLVPLEVGTTIQLNDVLFERGTANILENSYSQLNNVAQMMLENPNLIIELAGHTDNQGVSKLNIKLSQERVERVKSYIVDKGVQAKRISGKGYGGIKPIASNKSEETRKLNRRVEFTIVKN